MVSHTYHDLIIAVQLDYKTNKLVTIPSEKAQIHNKNTTDNISVPIKRKLIVRYAMKTVV